MNTINYIPLVSFLVANECETRELNFISVRGTVELNLFVTFLLTVT